MVTQSAPKIFIIAEAGVNHNGDLGSAHKLIDAAVEAGADAVKFQTFEAQRLAAKSAGRARYQERAVGGGSQVDMLRSLELKPEWHAELAGHCREAGVEFMSTPFHKEAADLLLPLVSRFKIGSGDLTDLPLLEHVSKLGKPMILSTGMSGYAEIEAAVRVVRRRPVPLALLHCTSLYPAPVESINLRAIETLRAAFGLPVGYSDHTAGLAVAIAAAALGAAILEKHFTLDRKLPGPDHAASLEPSELRLMVESVRRVEAAMGNGVKRVMAGEDAMRLAARKSLVAGLDLEAGTVLLPEMIAVKRPGTGIAPADLDKVVRRTLRRGIRADEAFSWDMF